jgi:hypothetical protein
MHMPALNNYGMFRRNISARIPQFQILNLPQGVSLGSCTSFFHLLTYDRASPLLSRFRNARRRRG